MPMGQTTPLHQVVCWRARTTQATVTVTAHAEHTLGWSIICSLSVQDGIALVTF